MWTKTWGILAGICLLFAALVALASAAGNAGVLVSRDGQGAYIGDFYGHIPYPDPADYCGTGRAAGSPGCAWSLEQNSNNAIALVAISPSVVKVYLHQGVYCYKSGSVSSSENFFGTSLNFSFPGIDVSANGGFDKSGTGRRGYVTLSGQISGDTASGVFSLQSSHDGKDSCMTLKVPWKATFNPKAEPNPLLFR